MPHEGELPEEGADIEQGEGGGIADAMGMIGEMAKSGELASRTEPASEPYRITFAPGAAGMGDEKPGDRFVAIVSGTFDEIGEEGAMGTITEVALVHGSKSGVNMDEKAAKSPKGLAAYVGEQVRGKGRMGEMAAAGRKA
jgi:hypothetical protein